MSAGSDPTDSEVAAGTADGPAARDSAPTALARRVGPIVAAIGVLGAAATLAWVAVAPDNVVGDIADSGLVVAATAAMDGGEDGCLRLVAGDGSERQLCPDGLDTGDLHGVWSDDGGLVVHTGDEQVVVDAETGVVTERVPAGRAVDVPPRLTPDVHVDGTVVRTGEYGRDGEVVFDLGGPVASLRSAVMSPSRTWVVAADDDGRVLVASAAEPETVYRWFSVDEEVWFDPWTEVRWDE